ncbi:MAG: hypothetical protein AAFO04_09060 [Cyanobacteria bacterium J06592_8]
MITNFIEKPGSILRKLKFAPNKIKREVRRLPVLQSLLKHKYQASLIEHINRLPAIPESGSIWVNEMQQYGVSITSLDQLSIPSTSAMIEAAEKLIQDFPTLSNQDTFEISPYVPTIPHSYLVQHYLAIFLWGLEEQLLNIIENYIGLPIRYQGAEFRRGIANGKVVDVRRWHIDTEDHRMFKIILYLNDVNSDGGPFECLPKPLSTQAINSLKYYSGFVLDSTMETAVPKSEWKTCTGKLGTAVFADTCNIFHRAKAPTARERYSVTFSYTSIQPIEYRSKLKFTPEQWQLISNQLTRRQIDCID